MICHLININNYKRVVGSQENLMLLEEQLVLNAALRTKRRRVRWVAKEVVATYRIAKALKRKG